MALVAWHTIPKYFQEPEYDPEDVRTDPYINRSEPLFRQIVGMKQYGWLQARFESLPRLLGNWTSSYYGTDVYQINLDYTKTFRESVPMKNPLCQLARLLLVDEIEEALGDKADAFFKRTPYKVPNLPRQYRQRPYALLRVGDSEVVYGKYTEGFICPGGYSKRVPSKDPILGTGLDPTNEWGIQSDGTQDLMACCGQLVGRIPGCWIAIAPDNEAGEIRKYLVWYTKERGAAGLLEALAADEENNIANMIRSNFEIGTAFKDASYYIGIHKEIQQLLQTLAKSLIQVYDALVESLDAKIDTPSIRLYNPYREMPRETLELLKRLIYLVDTFNRPHNVCDYPPRIEAEWEDAVNGRVFATHLGSLYFREDTRNFAVFSQGRVNLLRPNVLDPDRVKTLREETASQIDQNVVKTLVELEQTIRSLPNVDDVKEYDEITQVLSSELRNRLPSLGNFLSSYNSSVDRLKEIQRNINKYYKTKMDISNIQMPTIPRKPDMNLGLAQQALQYFNAYNNMYASENDLSKVKNAQAFPGLETIYNRLDWNRQLEERVLEPQRQYELFMKTIPVVASKYKEPYDLLKKHFTTWVLNASRLINMNNFNSIFVDEFREKVGRMAEEMLESGDIVKRNNAIIAEEEQKMAKDAETAAKNRFLVFLMGQTEGNKGIIANVRSMAKTISSIPSLFYEVLDEFQPYANAMRKDEWELLIDIVSEPNKNYDDRIESSMKHLKLVLAPVENVKVIQLDEKKRQAALAKYPPHDYLQGDNLISEANLEFKDNSCPFDSMFSLLFKTPQSWFEQEIRKSQVVYSLAGKNCTTSADTLHEAILSDIDHVQSLNPRTVCRTKAFWMNCFSVDIQDRAGAELDDPRGMTLALLNFYNVSNKVETIQVAPKDIVNSFPKNIEHGKELIMVNISKSTGNFEFLGRTDYNVPEQLGNGEYTILGAYSYSLSGPHYTAIVRDPRSKQWWEFDGTKEHPFKLKKGGIPEEATKGPNIGKGPMGWVYARTEWLEKAANASSVVTPQGTPSKGKEEANKVTPAPAPPPPPPSQGTPSKGKEEANEVTPGSVAPTEPATQPTLPVVSTVVELPKRPTPMDGEFPIRYERLFQLYNYFKNNLSFVLADPNPHIITIRFANQETITGIKKMFEYFLPGLYIDQIPQFYGNVDLSFNPDKKIFNNDFQLRAILYGIERLLDLAALGDKTGSKSKQYQNDIRTCIMMGRVFIPPQETNSGGSPMDVLKNVPLPKGTLQKTKEQEESDDSEDSDWD